MAQLIKTFRDLAISSVKTIGDVPIASIKSVRDVDNTAGGGGGTSPGVTNIVAWYDFADGTDADGNTLPLTDIGTPSYTAGPPSYGTSSDGAPGNGWRQNTLDTTLNAAGNWSIVIRFRALSGIVSGDYIVTGNGSRTAVNYSTTAGVGIRGKIGTATFIDSAVVPSENVWYTVVVTRNDTSGISSISVNGATFVTASTTESHNVGDFVFGGNSTAATNPMDIDFCGIWNRALTQDEVTWLYNSDGTRTYAEL
jgi:hypothetical protein